MAVNKDLKMNKLACQISGKKILQGVNLTIKPGKVIALMGPNGSGKSTLAQVLVGAGDYKVSGKVLWQGKDVLKMEPWERAKLGLFLSWQYPKEIPGVNMFEFLAGAYKSIHGQVKFNKDFENNLEKALKALGLDRDFLSRNVNENFSGGEKKKSEVLQLLLLKPKIAILDETDSGLDIDSLKLIAKNVKDQKSSQIGFLVITHYQRLLNFLEPDEVHVMLAGKIVKSGDKKLVADLEEKGYDWLR